MEIHTAGIEKRYGETVALAPTSLTVKEGEFVSLLGPSGCGKTTLLRSIAGLERPDNGRISLGDQVVFDHTQQINTAPEKRGVGMVFQDFALWPHMTVFENVAFGLRARNQRGLTQILRFSQPPPGQDNKVIAERVQWALANNIAEGFTAATGIEVDLFQGTTGAVLGRLEAERDNPNADVVVLASWPAGMGLYEEGLLLQYSDAANADLLVPEWYQDGYLFGYSASALGITYNTNVFPDQPGSDWDSFTDPQFQDLVAMPDPSLSGSALDFLAGYISNNPDGWSLFDQLAANGIEVAGANRPALDGVVSGSRGLVLAGVDYMAYGDMARGEPLGIFYPASGTVVNPRPAMILASSNSPNNARAFIDYMLSDEAQQMVVDAYILPGHTDIAAHPDRIGLEGIPQFAIDWDWMMANQETINAQFQEINR